MRVELIEAVSAKDLVDDINRFVEHVELEYHDDPYVQIATWGLDKAGYKPWTAFVFFRNRKAGEREVHD